MHHVAIMKPEWKFISKILSGEKKVETRWYMQRRAPWGRISAGDLVFFKDAGKPVTAMAVVDDVEETAVRDDRHRRELLERIGLHNIGADREVWYEIDKYTKEKRYMIAVWLRNPKPVRPFEISKRGFGAMASWITVPHISGIIVGHEC